MKLIQRLLAMALVVMASCTSTKTVQNIPLEEMNPIERFEVVYQKKHGKPNFSHADYVTKHWLPMRMLYLPKPTGRHGWEFSSHVAWGEGFYVRDSNGPVHYVDKKKYQAVCDWAHAHGLEVHRFVHMGEVYHPVVID